MKGVNRKGIQQSVDVYRGLSSGISHRVLHCTTKGIAGTLQTLKNESPKREKSGKPAFPSVFPDEVLDFFHYEFVFPVS